MTHVPVLQEAAVNALNVRENGIYVDATFGRGGHSRLILERLGPQGRLIAMDIDPTAIAEGRRLFENDPRLALIHSNFSEIDVVVREQVPEGRVDGILMDLGVSSPQLDTPGRGFSFRHEGPLDMRLNAEAGESAAQWLAHVDEAELVRVLKQYGEERFARRIARAVIEQREIEPIRTTSQLSEIVEKAIPAAARRADRIHPATRTFQAVRIAINAELEVLPVALAAAIEVLADHGRLVVISFHSLEDRLVKQAIRTASSPPQASRRLPVAPAFKPRLKPVGKLVRPASAEARENPRARSARMRVAERVTVNDVGGLR
ncbi:MAG: 16S rRNA (cytosine(1402)-N(4))-methyltransferase RsmH [Wenzhouxiangellaceae bacterium]|nr:16S rRNA (cytosine(1402)-N(4))-methyltransferase RsmH [Wenzhouxiangellaceae bacterium]